MSRENLAFGWPHRVVAGLLMLLGAGFVTVTLTANLFHVGPAFDRLTDDFRPLMTEQSLQIDQQSINSLSAASAEIRTTMLPALAQQLGMTTDQMTQMMAQQYPAVTAGLNAVPDIAPQFTSLVNTLDAQRPYFAEADAIPTESLPAATVPWSLLVVGLVTIGVGVWLWFKPLAGSWAAAILGALLIAVPLILSLPHKADYADTMNSNLKPVYNQQLIDQANGALATLGAMGTEMQTKMLPDLAAQLKMTPDEMNAMLGQYFPITAAALAGMPDSMARFQNLVATFDNRLADYNTMKPVTLVPIVWFMIGGGIGLFVLGAIGAFITPRGRREA